MKINVTITSSSKQESQELLGRSFFFFLLNEDDQNFSLKAHSHLKRSFMDVSGVLDYRQGDLGFRSNMTITKQGKAPTLASGSHGQKQQRQGRSLRGSRLLLV